MVLDSHMPTICSIPPEQPDPTDFSPESNSTANIVIPLLQANAYLGRGCRVDVDTLPAKESCIH